MQQINTRSNEMWRIIFSALDSTWGVRVIDLGAGYGDIALRFAKAGADVMAVERDPQVYEVLASRVAESAFDNIVAIKANIEDDGFPVWGANGTDILVLTSVLPYITRPDDLLSKMSKSAKKSIIECQYAGDGPGFSHIEDDHDMQMWLVKYWPSVHKIGETKLDIRPASRTIWLCESARMFS